MATIICFNKHSEEAVVHASQRIIDAGGNDLPFSKIEENVTIYLAETPDGNQWYININDDELELIKAVQSPPQNSSD
jgi:hypothetical protein